MPGKTNGLELARIVIACWPSLKAVLTSGFPDTAPSLTGMRLLRKPYLKRDLSRVFREVLEN